MPTFPLVDALADGDALARVEARDLALAAAVVMAQHDDPARIAELAAPVIAWLDDAHGDADLFTRAQAVKRATAALELALARGGVRHTDGGEAFAVACAGYYAVLTAPPAAGDRPGSPPVGRALYAVRNLLLAATEPGLLDPDAPGPAWDALVACAARFAGDADPPLAPQEYATALRMVMTASPRPGSAGFIPEEWVTRAQLQWLIDHRAFPAADPDPAVIDVGEPERAVWVRDVRAVLAGKAWYLPPHPAAAYDTCEACGFPRVPGMNDRYDVFLVPDGATPADPEAQLVGAAVPGPAASIFRREYPAARLVLHCQGDEAAVDARHAWEAATPCGLAGPGGCAACHPATAIWWAPGYAPGGSAAGRSPADNGPPPGAFGPDLSPVAAGPEPGGR